MTLIITYINNSELVFSQRIVESLLTGITIAMATIPEEIPVILTVFLAIGAWELTREKTLTKNMKTIENLATINVLCTDKTGTITENKMNVQYIYSFDKEFLDTLYYACPVVAYDPMKIAIKEYCKEKEKFDIKFKITKEYAFTLETKMMCQVLNDKILCVKDAYESVMSLCNLSKEDYEVIVNKINEFASEGYRVLAVARNDNLEEIPDNLFNSRL